MRTRWMKQPSVWVIGLMIGALGCWAVPSALAGFVQGGEFGSGEEGSAIKTFVANTAARGNAVPVGINNISVLGKGSLLYGMKLIALAANANCDFYDATTVAGAADTTVIDELAEATANGTAVQMWPNPYRITTGLSIGARNAVCIAYYR